MVACILCFAKLCSFVAKCNRTSSRSILFNGVIIIDGQHSTNAIQHGITLNFQCTYWKMCSALSPLKALRWKHFNFALFTAIYTYKRGFFLQYFAGKEHFYSIVLSVIFFFSFSKVRKFYYFYFYKIIILYIVNFLFFTNFCLYRILLSEGKFINAL